MQAESIIFDIDGTLWDSRHIVARGYNEYLTAHGMDHLQVTGEYLGSLFGRTMTEIADVFLAEIPVPRRYEILQACMASEHEALVKDPCHIDFPGVVPTLEKLAKGHRLFIVSNSQCGYPELVLEKLNIGHLIEGHMCFGDTGLSKGETMKILMQRHNIRSAVYVGDTQGDLDACRHAGIPFIFCRYGFGSPESWDAAVDSFPQLLEIFG